MKLLFKFEISTHRWNNFAKVLNYYVLIRWMFNGSFKFTNSNFHRYVEFLSFFFNVFVWFIAIFPTFKSFDYQFNFHMLTRVFGCGKYFSPWEFTTRLQQLLNFMFFWIIIYFCSISNHICWNRFNPNLSFRIDMQKSQLFMHRASTIECKF